MNNQPLSAQAVILTGDGDRGALDLLRSFARENIRSVVVSTEPNDIASASHIVKRSFWSNRMKKHTMYNPKVLRDSGSIFGQLFLCGEDINMLLFRNRDSHKNISAS
jgi:hypothetical protein